MDKLVIAAVAAVVAGAAASLLARRRLRREVQARERADAALREALARLAAAKEGQAAQIERHEKDVERREAQVEALNREIETLAYSISHDLRTPLRHISGYVQLLTQALEGKLEPEAARYFAVVAQASHQMNALIDGLLAYSRLTRAELAPAAVATRDVVDSAIASLAAETRGRDIDWRVGELPPVEADVSMLKTVYTHLLGNAVKFTIRRERAVIEIGSTGDEDGRAVLFVRDNGVGFDPTYADRLFGLFQRLHPPEEFEGTGIGLATVQRIIARHGGRIWAHAAPGEGAAFYFTLPKAA